MPELDFGKLEVSTYHSFVNVGNMEEAWENYKLLSTIFVGNVDLKNGFGYEDPNDNGPAVNVNFDNTQLDCELTTIDSLEANSDAFQFIVYNVPENTIFYQNDIVTFKYYWEADPSRVSIYHGLVEFIKVERGSGDIKTTLKGKLIHQNILYHWSAFKVYNKIQKYSELADVLYTELGLTLSATTIELSRETKLKSPILTRRKTMGEILDHICEELHVEWRLVNNSEVLIYTQEELEQKLLNERYDIEVLHIKYNDILELGAAHSTDEEEGDLSNYKVKMYGLPLVKPGTVIVIDTSNTPDYVTLDTTSYVIDEIENDITLKDGFMTTCYVHRVGTDDES